MNLDEIFDNLENTKPFLKLALEGFAGDGKTYTAAEIAIGVHKLIKSNKPIAVVDTEKALSKIKFKFDEAGISVKTTSARTLATLNAIINMCSDQGYADVLIIDSITHIWEDFLEAYKTDKKRQALQFQDWGILKPKWKKEFSTPFVDAKCHIIFTGRAGYEYSTEVNEETQKREIYKSGIKMKAETETQFEPDVLVHMEKVVNILDKKKEIYRTATILKDRTTLIDGKSFNNPTFDDFYPCINRLLEGTLKEVHGVILPDTFKEFESRYSENVKIKEQCIADIDGCFALIGLGTGSADKQTKAWIIKNAFGTHSIESAVSAGIDSFERGTRIIKSFTQKYVDYLESIIETGETKSPEVVKSLMSEARFKYTNVGS